MPDPQPPTDESAESAQSLYDQASKRFAQGDYAAARSLFEQALAIFEGLSGANPLDTARCLNSLGQVIEQQGDAAAAQPFVERALALRRQRLGAEHPDTVQSLHLLGEVRFDRGDFDTGQALTAQALEIRKRLLGDEHPDTIENTKSLALMLAYRGDRARAEQLLTQALPICERVLGEEHRVTLKVLNALGLVWEREESTRLSARPVYERALAINERLKGPNHPDTAQSLNNLAALLADIQDYAAARPLLERSLVLHEQSLGPKNPRTAFVLVNLADVYSKERNYAAARSLYERALVIREQTLGAQHPETLRSLRKVVALLGNLKKQGDQQVMLIGMPLHTCLMALEAAAGTLSPENQRMPGARLDPAKAAEQLHDLVAKLEADLNRPPLSAADQADLETAHALRRQADELYDRGDYVEAQARLERALAVQERVLGQDHLDHVDLLKKLAKTKKARGQYGAVLPLIQRVANIHIQVLGPHHPTTGIALSELALYTMREYDTATAMPLQERVLKSMEDALGSGDPNVVRMRDSVNRMKEALAERGEGKEPPRLSRSQKREQALATLPPERAALLAGIERIDWHALHHAYGPSDDVPNLLRLLLSDDEEVQNDAWEELYGNVWHQGTVYQATAPVVPFMLKMLTYKGPPDKSALLRFLIDLAEGSSGLAAHTRTAEDRLKWQEILSKMGRGDFDTELEEELGWVQAVNRAVGEGIPIYFELLAHKNPEITRLALTALARVRGRTDEIVPRLQTLLPTVQDVQVRAGVVRTLHDQMGDSDQAQQFFADLRGEGEQITFIAAVALATRARDRTPEGAVTILLNAIRDLGQIRSYDYAASVDTRAKWDAIRARFDPLWGEAALSFALQALTHLGTERAIAALLRALPMIQDGEDALELAGMSLDLVFNDGKIQYKATAIGSVQEGTVRRAKIEYWEPKPQPPHAASTLTETQRTVLAAIVGHDPVWEPRHDLLKLYGLPMSRDDLRQFIA